METRVNFITLGVRDLEKSLAFYKAFLDVPSNGIIGTEFHDAMTGADGTIAFFEVGAGLTLGLYARENLAKDASLPQGQPSATEFSLGYPASSQAEVAAVLARAEAAGATLTKEPHLRPWGAYSAYLQDPDGHLWEVVWNSAG